jgi:hypothetical protein
MASTPGVSCATVGTPPAPACIFCGMREDPVGAGMSLFWLALVAYCCYLSGRKLLRRLHAVWPRLAPRSADPSPRPESPQDS